MSSTVEDPRQPDWAKHKSLQEIANIRQLKKDLIINQMARAMMPDAHRIHMYPGEPSFFQFPIENNGLGKLVYDIKISDEEKD